MTRKEMDKLDVGHKVEVRVYNTSKEEYEWIPAIVSQIYVCASGRKFAHGGYHSAVAKVKGHSEILDSALTRFPLT